MLKTLSRKIFFQSKFILQRSLSHYPIDETIFGLTEEQIKLRETTFSFAQKELAPHAQKIDRSNDFKELRSFWKKLRELGNRFFVSIRVCEFYTRYYTIHNIETNTKNQIFN